MLSPTTAEGLSELADREEEEDKHGNCVGRAEAGESLGAIWELRRLVLGLAWWGKEGRECRGRGEWSGSGDSVFVAGAKMTMRGDAGGDGGQGAGSRA